MDTYEWFLNKRNNLFKLLLSDPYAELSAMDEAIVHSHKGHIVFDDISDNVAAFGNDLGWLILEKHNQFRIVNIDWYNHIFTTPDEIRHKFIFVDDQLID
jgi:hypothetical protein